uniref:Uncharacterized protein n=1 Tax=Romanomermis culicivorax TaxID=13658 RepID=A0A915JX20_ROMCU
MANKSIRVTTSLLEQLLLLQVDVQYKWTSGLIKLMKNLSTAPKFFQKHEEDRHDMMHIRSTYKNKWKTLMEDVSHQKWGKHSQWFQYPATASTICRGQGDHRHITVALSSPRIETLMATKISEPAPFQVQYTE